jgi:hypothetical protein
MIEKAELFAVPQLPRDIKPQSNARSDPCSPEK